MKAQLTAYTTGTHLDGITAIRCQVVEIDSDTISPSLIKELFQMNDIDYECHEGKICVSVQTALEIQSKWKFTERVPDSILKFLSRPLPETPPGLENLPVWDKLRNFQKTAVKLIIKSGDGIKPGIVCKKGNCDQ